MAVIWASFWWWRGSVGNVQIEGGMGSRAESDGVSRRFGQEPWAKQADDYPGHSGQSASYLLFSKISLLDGFVSVYELTIVD